MRSEECGVLIVRRSDGRIRNADIGLFAKPSKLMHSNQPIAVNFRYSDGAAAVSPFPCHPGPLRVKVVPMEFQIEEHDYDYESNVKVFHDLMSVKVNDILLVSTPYDAFYHGGGRQPGDQDHPRIPGPEPEPSAAYHQGIFGR